MEDKRLPKQAIKYGLWGRRNVGRPERRWSVQASGPSSLNL
jgi:hypothetical protein